MSKTVMILVDGTEITMEDNSSMSNVQVVFKDKASMIAIWDKLTPANLKTIILQIDGKESGKYTDQLLENEQSTVRADGTILTEFHIREKTEIEKLREEIEALKSGQSVQDGAIDDLGAVTSTLAEQMEGGVQ